MHIYGVIGFAIILAQGLILPFVGGGGGVEGVIGWGGGGWGP